MDGSSPIPLQRLEVESAVVRFAGDSGDGMQVTGSQFTLATALAGNDLATFPDFPAEIRAPVGTTFGVSAYQINFGAREIRTAGDEIDVLVAMNPAALKVNLREVKPGGLLILDSDAFNKRNFAKAGYEAIPGQVSLPTSGFEIDITAQTERAVAGLGLSKKEAQRCKNFWALGLVYWLFDRDRQPTREWLERRFSDRPDLVAANCAALDAGHAWGETAELPSGISAWRVPAARLEPGTYRNITGAQALTWGLLAGAQKAGLGMSFAVIHHARVGPASQPCEPEELRRRDLSVEDRRYPCRHRASYAGFRVTAFRGRVWRQDGSPGQGSRRNCRWS